MSFILDALRKVDQQRGPSDDPGPVAPGLEALQQERARRRHQYAAMAAIAAVSAVVTAAALRMLPTPEAPPVIEELGATPSAPVVPVSEPESTASASVITEEKTPPVRAPRPSPEPPPAPLPTETGPMEVSEAEPETVAGTIRVIGEASPTRSITHSPAEVPEATDPADLPPNFPRLVLQGTSMLDGKPVAVVSDRRVFEGDSIEGATVVRIEERSVELEFQGRRFTLTL